MGIINNDNYINPHTGQNIVGTYFHIGTKNPLIIMKLQADTYEIRATFLIHYSLEAATNGYPFLTGETLTFNVNEQSINNTSVITLAYNNLKAKYTNYTDV